MILLLSVSHRQPSLLQVFKKEPNLEGADCKFLSPKFQVFQPKPILSMMDLLIVAGLTRPEITSFFSDPLILVIQLYTFVL